MRAIVINHVFVSECRANDVKKRQQRNKRERGNPNERHQLSYCTVINTVIYYLYLFLVIQVLNYIIRVNFSREKK